MLLAKLLALIVHFFMGGILLLRPMTEYSLPVLTERLHELRECGKKSVLYSLSINEYPKKRNFTIFLNPVVIGNHYAFAMLLGSVIPFFCFSLLYSSPVPLSFNRNQRCFLE